MFQPEPFETPTALNRGLRLPPSLQLLIDSVAAARDWQLGTGRLARSPRRSSFGLSRRVVLSLCTPLAGESIHYRTEPLHLRQRQRLAAKARDIPF
jgi:hypothetical protein